VSGAATPGSKLKNDAPDADSQRVGISPCPLPVTAFLLPYLRTRALGS
jgi:hypothetical protein